MVAQRDAQEAADRSIEDLITIEPTTGLKVLPHWLAQPYFRPLNSKHPETEATSPKGKSYLRIPVSMMNTRKFKSRKYRQKEGKRMNIRGKEMVLKDPRLLHMELP